MRMTAVLTLVVAFCCGCNDVGTDEPVEDWRRAAEQGDARAQCNLGLAYAQGEGVAKDLAFAYKWLYIAGIRNADARARRQRLAQSMTPEQIAEGRRLSREWLQARTF